MMQLVQVQLQSNSRMELRFRFEWFHFHIVYYLKYSLGETGVKFRANWGDIWVDPGWHWGGSGVKCGWIYLFPWRKISQKSFEQNSAEFSYLAFYWLITSSILRHNHYVRTYDVISSQSLDLIGQFGRDILQLYLLPIFCFRSEFLHRPNISDLNLSCILECILECTWACIGVHFMIYWSAIKRAKWRAC